MCGIVAQLGKSDQFEAAVAAIAHRGVRTKVTEGRWGRIAHARLPIVGVGEENDQPQSLVSRTGTQWTIAFVGEVLDYRDTNEGQFEDSDLWTVIRGWLDMRERCLVGHDGFWSVVAMDETSGAIHVVVDYLAQKPMYYRRDVCGVASEPHACALLGPVTPDEIYFAAVAKWGYCPEPRRTPFRQIKKTLPGEHVVLGQAPSRKIVDPLVPYHLSRLPTGVLKGEIMRAVERRVRSSDVPVALLYSGGLDSSIVRVVAERYGDVKTYTTSDGVAEDVDIEDVDTLVPPASEVTVERKIDYMQEPIDLGSVAPQIVMSDSVTERVCLTGDGADELFGGYGRALRYDSQWSDVYHELVCYHLPRLDRVMMRNRVEVRSPFLARRVCEIALGLPRELRTNKKILRDLFYPELLDRADVPKVPLRTREIEEGREASTLRLIEEFRRRWWPA